MWQEALNGSLDGEMRARIIGVEAQMMKFDFLSGVFLGSLILRHSDNLSKTLQHKALPASEGQRIAKLTQSVLQKIRSDEQLAAFYQLVVQEQARFGVADPCLPRKRRAPQRFEVALSYGELHVTPEGHTARYTMGH